MIVGYAGTAFRYDVSVFGAPVALAARCAGVKVDDPDLWVSSTIAMPASEWGKRALTDVVPAEGSEARVPRFELRNVRDVPLKGLGSVAIREIYSTGMHLPGLSAEGRAVENLKALKAGNRYWPRRSSSAPA